MATSVATLVKLLDTYMLTLDDTDARRAAKALTDLYERLVEKEMRSQATVAGAAHVLLALLSSSTNDDMRALACVSLERLTIMDDVHDEINVQNVVEADAVEIVVNVMRKHPPPDELGEDASKVMHNIVVYSQWRDGSCPASVKAAKRALQHRMIGAGLVELLVQRMLLGGDEEVTLEYLCRGNDDVKRRAAAAGVHKAFSGEECDAEEDGGSYTDDSDDDALDLQQLLRKYHPARGGVPPVPPPIETRAGENSISDADVAVLTREFAALLQRLPTDVAKGLTDQLATSNGDANAMRHLVHTHSLRPQRQVVVQGLASRQDLNGCPGRILSRQNAAERWPVRVYAGGGSEDVRVKSANLYARAPPLYEMLEEGLWSMLLETAPPATAARLLCCSRALARLAERTWKERFHRLGPSWSVLATRQLKGYVSGAKQWREKYARAVSDVRKADAQRAAEPTPDNFRGVDVCEEYATLRAIVDSPAQVHPAMGSYEGFLGQFKQTSTALGTALFQKGGRDLMVAFLDTYVHDSMLKRTVDFAWAKVEGANWRA